MRVQDIRIAAAPAARLRLQARVSYADRRRSSEVLWFEVPETLGAALDDVTGNAFFVALLPLATVLEQRLELEAPVDEPLLRRAPEVRELWSRWYGTRTNLKLAAPARPAPAAGAGRRAAFFSGGIDSTFTAWQGTGRVGTAPPPAPLDELWFLEGFDIPVGATSALAAARANASEAAGAVGLPLHTIATNLRETRWREADWSLLAHGPALGAAALALGRRLCEARVASSVFAGRDVAWGSHPESTRRFSSWTLDVHEDGFEHDRMPKLRALAQHPAAIRHLRVCWHSPTGENCGVCKKCIFARVMLDLLVGEDACPGLPRAPDLVARLGALPVRSGDEWSDAREIHREALARGRADVARALAPALSGDPTVRDLTTLPRPRSMRRPWWKRLANRALLWR